MSDFLVLLLQRKVEDIHAVCGLLKDFFRKLAEPLVTYDLWSAFVDAASELHYFFYVFGFFRFIQNCSLSCTRDSGIDPKNSLYR